MDLLSYVSFKDEKIRKSVWKEPFTHFLPVYINEEHSNISLFKDCISEIYEVKEFDAIYAANVMIKLLNTQVVNIMSGKMHNSIKALEGYFYFHRWLIWIVSEYPEIQKIIDDKIEKFIENENERNKKNVVIIGEFIALLSVSSKNWFQVSNSLLKEVFTRNVFWALKIHPELHFDLDPIFRRKIIFETSNTMLKLIAFHVNFLKLVRPEGLELNEISDDYDLKLGQPSFLLQEEFQRSVFKIQKISNWEQFFNEIEIEFQESNLDQVLKWSIKRSFYLNYHITFTSKKINSIENVIKFNPYKPYKQKKNDVYVPFWQKKEEKKSWSPWDNDMKFSVDRLKESEKFIKKDEYGNFIQIVKLPTIKIKKFIKKIPKEQLKVKNEIISYNSEWNVDFN